MNVQRALKILNEAYRIEVEGFTFYKNMENGDISSETKTIFKYLSDEEKKHQDFIMTQISNIKESGSFGSLNIGEHKDDVMKLFLDSIKVAKTQTITEASSLHIGILLEKNSYDFYTDSAKEAEDYEERKLYSSLAEWELTHLDILQSAYQTVREKIFADQRFSPF